MPSPERERERKAAKVSRLWPLVSATVAIGVVVGAGALLSFRQTGLELDAEWMHEVLGVRSAFLELPARLMDFVGGGWFAVFAVPIATAILLIAGRRKWAAGYYLLAAILSAVSVQVLKQVFGRARPEEILVATDYGSFPSGHVANAATIAVALGIVFARTWVWVLGAVYSVLMALSRTYLGAHWLSDTLGGLLLGAGVAIVVWAPFAHVLNRERAAADEPRRRS